MTYKITKVNAVHGGEAYLITSGKDAFLYDTGYAINVDKTIKNIEEHLGDSKLEAIILGHSHYDHVMGSPAINEHFPDVIVYAHPLTRRIFNKPNALKVMEEMNLAAAKDRKLVASEGWTKKLKVDVDVSDGDIISVGDMKLRVIESPGHTYCSISLYIEKEGLLIAAESLGVPLDPPNVVPAFIVSCDDAINSIKRARALKPKSVLLPHSSLISGKDIDVYFENSLKETLHVKETALALNEKGCTIDEIVQHFKDIYYKGNFRDYQPDEAFYANWFPLVTRLINPKD